MMSTNVAKLWNSKIKRLSAIGKVVFVIKWTGAAMAVTPIRHIWLKTHDCIILKQISEGKEDNKKMT